MARSRGSDNNYKEWANTVRESIVNGNTAYNQEFGQALKGLLKDEAGKQDLKYAFIRILSSSHDEHKNKLEEYIEDSHVANPIRGLYQDARREYQAGQQMPAPAPEYPGISQPQPAVPYGGMGTAAPQPTNGGQRVWSHEELHTPVYQPRGRESGRAQPQPAIPYGGMGAATPQQTNGGPRVWSHEELHTPVYQPRGRDGVPQWAAGAGRGNHPNGGDAPNNRGGGGLGR